MRWLGRRCCRQRWVGRAPPDMPVTMPQSTVRMSPYPCQLRGRYAIEGGSLCAVLVPVGVAVEGSRCLPVEGPAPGTHTVPLSGLPDARLHDNVSLYTKLCPTQHSAGRCTPNSITDLDTQRHPGSDCNQQDPACPGTSIGVSSAHTDACLSPCAELSRVRRSWLVCGRASVRSCQVSAHSECYR